MFIRVKKVKKKSGIYEYAHLVSGVWRRKRLKTFDDKRKFVKFENSIHKYGGFLGRVYRFHDSKKEIGFENYFGNFREFVEKNNIEDIYKKLISYELLCSDFKDVSGIFINKNLHVDLNRFVVHGGSKDVVIKMKDFSGYLCSLTLENLFQIKKIESKYDGVYLLKKLKSIGIQLNPDNFYVLANKLIKNNG